VQKEMEKRAQAARGKPSRRPKKDDFAIFRELDNDTSLELAGLGAVPATIALNKGLSAKKRPAKGLPRDAGTH
jgi:hypothetical protein